MHGAGIKKIVICHYLARICNLNDAQITAFHLSTPETFVQSARPKFLGIFSHLQHRYESLNSCLVNTVNSVVYSVSQRKQEQCPALEGRYESRAVRGDQKH
jgi:hypothetical protein